jgi:proteasome lid subunit RPN8/RPN11
MIERTHARGLAVVWWHSHPQTSVRSTDDADSLLCGLPTLGWVYIPGGKSIEQQY